MTTGLKPGVELELDRFALDPYCKLHLPLWKLDGDSFADRSAYGHLCTNYGSLWTPRGRSFDGVDDYVDCGAGPGNLLVGSNQLTIEAWIKPQAGDNDAILGWNDLNDIYQLLLISNHPYLNIKTTSGNKNIQATNSVTLSAWSHVVARYNGATLNIWINGVLDSTSTSWSGTLVRGVGISLLIGSYHSYPDYVFNGLIGLALIYSRALTPQEILDHYIIGKEMFG